MSTFTLGAPANPNQSIQGALSSQYSNWVQDEVKDAADAIAYKWFEATGDLDTALAIRSALERGKFSVDDLFLAENGKSSLGSDLAGQPNPKLVVAGQTIKLADFFSGTEVTEWTSGNAKNVQYHAREYFKQFDAGEAPTGWDNPAPPNQPPEAAPIHVVVTETASEYNAAHEITNLGADIHIVHLIDGVASDPDKDVLHIVKDSVTVVDGGGSGKLPPYIKVVGDTIEIDQNHRDLDDLREGDTMTINLTYEITDGHNHTITNTVEIVITGTADEYEGHGSGSVSREHFYASNNKGGTAELTIDTSVLPEGQFDFHNFTGKISASSSGLTGNQKVNITDDGKDDWSLDPGGAMSQVSDGQPASRNLDPHALDDGKVDYHFNFNQGDAGDKVTVTLDYQYDYWYLA